MARAVKIPGVEFKSYSKLSKNRPKVVCYVDDGIAVEKVPGVVGELTEFGELIEYKWQNRVNYVCVPPGQNRRIDYETGKRIIGVDIHDLNSVPVCAEGSYCDVDLARAVLEARPAREGVEATKQDKFDMTKIIWPALIGIVLIVGMYLYSDYQKTMNPQPVVEETKK